MNIISNDSLFTTMITPTIHEFKNLPLLIFFEIEIF